MTETQLREKVVATAKAWIGYNESERLIAGKKYIDAGGNGDVKHYYENLVREHTK